MSCVRPFVVYSFLIDFCSCSFSRPSFRTLFMFASRFSCVCLFPSPCHYIAVSFARSFVVSFLRSFGRPLDLYCVSPLLLPSFLYGFLMSSFLRFVCVPRPSSFLSLSRSRCVGVLGCSGVAFVIDCFRAVSIIDVFLSVCIYVVLAICIPFCLYLFLTLVLAIAIYVALPRFSYFCLCWVMLLVCVFLYFCLPYIISLCVLFFRSLFLLA